MSAPSPPSVHHERLAEVRAAFSAEGVARARAAGRFDARRIASESRALARLTRFLPPGPRLDVACGTGTLAPALSPRARLVGIDASPDMLREAVRAGAYRALLAADAASLPFRDASFRSAVAIRILHHLDEDGRRALLCEMRRVVDGPAIVSYYDAATVEALRAGRRHAPRSRAAIRTERLVADVAASGWSLVATSRKAWRLTQHVYAFLQPA